ncbi:MAG TPA: RNA 3'-terminal phosphate cyclase, partial [Methanotrichaceae archaeon]|nr:RNA 3'-terminal phosphate cyclase [Methanotrichaceae archaeon]
MIEIDGSHGEGGGQIVRTAVALSAVTGTSVRISKIRQGRPKPGLAAQHARAVEALAQICSGDIYGAQPGSSEITFVPGQVQGGRYSIDIGTAGSITLLVQCLLPALTTADGPVHLEIRGGTDVRWSPTIDYVRQVFLPALREFGASVEVLEVRRGYYPRGGGFVALDVTPRALRPAELLDPVVSVIEGISHSSNLPDHVAARQAESARQVLQSAGYEAEISTQAIK